MTARNLALTGVPRGGTTLACQLLGECRHTVALFEPMDVPCVPTDVDGAVNRVDDFYREMRRRLTQDGKGISKHRGGLVPDNPFDQDATAGSPRRDRTERGLIDLGQQPDDFTLVVKHNAMFTALLPALCAAFTVLAIVRNPLAVLSSWSTVDLPVADGRLPAGERLDPDLRERLRCAPDRLDRQCLILDWFFRRFEAHLPPAMVLRYEDIIATQGALLRDAAALTAPPRTDLVTRNASPVYARSDVDRLVDGLHRARSAGRAAWSTWYADTDIDALAARIAGASAR